MVTFARNQTTNQTTKQFQLSATIVKQECFQLIQLNLLQGT